ncbi:MAG: adenosylcobalamin-dependent ribonucleoside-diphosphate reductase [Nitrososphaerota archaeon]|nr:adenosylcobalamin-dependent ribonucleoside-diphosphate reductase [Nitrososphaerota archaeon]MDG6930694.1 adenosylcobalamin-dependent ribonucleoside-diphosphate reductase [Nitrososphaerota archaeon]MDG6931537.1 adenosylcobalamin-dependent ribonucleoside-diphosphate reductase [Nitrososphaerota archaeon]MDG6936270.1 adenosylcobalamin-dependent ribonucleoside-diphosphate reductase [Nitrososphaerota archaeon]MDG6944492.1 adenosylcobalamin-dependent ribonucleoside-diphosphate reductase [Nitrososph
MVLDRVVKRDGRIVSFDKNKIIEAVWKAQKAVGINDKAIALSVADLVVDELEARGGIPKVEDIQDIVEKKLIEKNQATIAKAYIVYREKRAEIREEKKKILNKETIDEVDKAFDINALRVLASRYLKKDESGKPIETPKELFTRVAIHIALPDIIYDERVFRKNGGSPFNYEQLDEGVSLKVGKYELNIFHVRALKELYDKMNSKGLVRVPWSTLVGMLGEMKNVENYIDTYYSMMVSKKFMPNTPALVNFGSYYGMGSACFVLDIEDSLDSIMNTLKSAAMIFQAGGGVGYNFSKLRPAGDFVKSTGGVASGPISFMGLFDYMTEVVKQGGVRRGANMGILNVNHPDIMKFITAKKGNAMFHNFNISVLIFPEFWEAYENGEKYPLVNPRNKKVVDYVDPVHVVDMISYQAWESAEPGIIYFDNMNKHNPLIDVLGPIMATNPCGETALYPNESCNLGSINVWAFVKEAPDGSTEYDWDGLKETVMLATRLLDNVIDINKYPLEQIEESTKLSRKIGLGIMGLADLLYELNLPYNDQKARDFMEQITEFFQYWSKVESVELAKERGPFPIYSKSKYAQGEMPFAGFYDRASWHFEWDKLADAIREYGTRHGFNLVFAPTGSISMIAGVSSGIEPVFALVYEKNVTVGSFYYTDAAFERIMQKYGLYSAELLKDVVAQNGTVGQLKYIPREIRRVFVTSMEIDPEDHVKALAAIQKWVDSSVSKTINMPSNVVPEDVRNIFMLAHRLGVKDITVYRDKSLKVQVLSAPKKQNEDGSGKQEVLVEAKGTQVGANCPVCGSKLEFKEGCSTCPVCGWSACASA